MTQTKTMLKLVRNMNLRLSTHRMKFANCMIVGTYGFSSVIVYRVDSEMTEPRL